MRPPTIKLITSLSLAAWVSFTAPSRGQETVEFDSYYGGPWSDGSRALVSLSDGGFALGGWKTVEGKPGTTEGWLIRLDARGRYLWDRPVSGTGARGIWALTPSLDGGLFVISDTSNNPSSNTRLTLFSGDGALQWVKTFGGAKQDRAKSIRPTLDGGLIMAGTTSLADQSESKGWIVKVDSRFETQWMRTIGQTAADVISDIAVTEQGEFVTAGSATRADGRTTGWIAKLSPSGGEIWQRQYDRSDLTQLHAVYPLKTGATIILGTVSNRVPDSRSRIIIALVSPDGIIDWELRPDIQGTHAAVGLSQRTDGLLLAAFNYATDQSHGTVVLLVNAAGQLVSVTRHPAVNPTQAKAITVSGPQGYAIAGTATGSAGTSEDAWFMLSTPIDQSTISPPRPAP